jgi:CorA-like Mg2+ transporter protein
MHTLIRGPSIGYKHIGKYYRQVPGCPEYLGLRVNSSAWFKSEPYELLLDFLASRPLFSRDLQLRNDNDLEYGLAYINAVQCIKNSAYQARPGLREVHQNADMEDVYCYGSWDDNVERLEFYQEHTLLTCGSPRFYQVVADRLHRSEDVLRQHADCALLYFTLARVSIENDEMMQDDPERALNKVFSRLKDNRDTDREHVELIFNLQQTVLDGLEYLEENKRELPIWGIPPFDNHHVSFHPEHSPPPNICDLIQREMELVDKDFEKIIEHWKSLERKVDRHLDILLQFRVLEQQELAISQRHMATQQQNLAIEEAKSSRVQSRSVFIFTAITIVFLPLSFFTSYFGMNLTDIVKTDHDTNYFWLIAGPTSGSIVIAIFIVTKCLGIEKEESPDLEKATTNSREFESETLWRSRPRLTKGKIKSS